MLLVWVLLSLLYLFIGVWFSLTVGMVIAPESQSNPFNLPDWAKFIVVILSGVIWPLTLLVFIGWGTYNKVTGK